MSKGPVKKRTLVVIISATLSLLIACIDQPASVYAQTAAPSTSGGLTFVGVVNNIVAIVNGGVIPLLFALAIIFFLINIVRFFFIEGGEEGQSKGKKALLVGGIGIAVLFSIWGIVNILLNTLNLAVGAAPGPTNNTTQTTTQTAPLSTQ